MGITVEDLSWKNIMDCKKHFFHIDNIIPVVRDAGYRFFIWNDWIYELLSDGNSYRQTKYNYLDIE